MTAHQIFASAVRASLLLIVLVVVLLAAGCTFARYSNPDHSLTVIDLHPTGNTVALDAALTGKGRLTLNREQGGTEGLVSEVGDIVSPNPLD